MKTKCNGIAILEDASGKRFEIQSAELNWEVVDVQDRSLGVETHYMATKEHEDLGTLSWNLWEYPIGLQNHNSTEVGQGRIIKDFDYSLEHENGLYFGDVFEAPVVAKNEEWTDIPQNEQIERMVSWFNRMFEDPQNQTPYADKESPHNYNYVWGGPYDALEEITDQFFGTASEEAIQKAAEFVENQSEVYEWAPSDAHPDMRRHAEEATAEYADKEHRTPSFEEIKRQISEAHRLEFGTPDELQSRRKLLALFQDFRPLVARSGEAQTHGGMGHNQSPPELALPQNVVMSITENIDVIEAEVSSDTPDAEKVADAAGTLQMLQEEIRDFCRMTKEQLKSQGSKALAAAILGGIGTLVLLAVKWISAALGFSIF